VCGIYAGTGVLAAGHRQYLSRALCARGPDGDAFTQYHYGFLGIRRLAIMSPEDGPGPYVTEDGRVSAVMNGEVYNEPALRTSLLKAGHTFCTNVDSEVLVHAYEEWGPSFVSRLNGMFAFALIDHAAGALYCARDRLGIKPLYYRQLGEQFVFASSVGALASLPGHAATVSGEALLECLYRQSILPPKTAYRQVAAIEPATMVQYDLAPPRHVKTVQFWRPQPAPATGDFDIETRDYSLRKAVHSGVRRQSHADRGTAVALSGGIDSGVLALERVAEQAYSLAALEPGDMGWRSETERAKVVAGIAGIRFAEVVADRSLTETVAAFVAAAEAPPVDGMNTFLLCRGLPRDVVVLFSGLGADELLHGYPELTTAVAREDMDATVARFFAATALLPLPILRRIGERLDTDADAVVESLREDAHSFLKALQVPTPIEALRLLLIRYYLSPCLLPDADCYSMANGVELRVPFLDNEIVDEALRWPYALLRSRKGSLGKAPLRKWAHTLGLPKPYALAPKQGFALQYGVLERALEETAGVRIAELPPPLALHARGPFRRWGLLAIEAWARRHIGQRLFWP
jgi:asparagine synthase (glutamine-hydrolysing)